MPISIYNSLTRKKEEFVPLNPPQVKMYVCGPTVYDEPHIGHARSAYVFDVIRRYLGYRGYQVKFVRNVTDVDDKIIDKARKEFKDDDLNVSVEKVAQKYLDSYHKDMQGLGIQEPDVEPKATEYVSKENPAMQKFIQLLIKRDAAYISDGDVYFDIKKAKDYGKLSGQEIEKMEAGSRIARDEKKKDPLDFALWKAAKEGEPSWESPWGRGRPGWHIECSVMSSEILGAEFDIHGGGLDLIFPHHENEIAQSEGAGNKFARVWMHHGLLTINEQKMAKSLGNFITIKDVLSKYPADVLKLFYLQAHYASPIDFSWEKIEEAYKSMQRFEILFQRIFSIKMPFKKSKMTIASFVEKHKKDFLSAMDDDFNFPRALGCLFDLVSETHKFITSGEKNDNYYATIDQVGIILAELGKKVFGITMAHFVEDGETFEEAHLLVERKEAREKKDYKRADEIREQLRKMGIIVEDAKDGGQVWRRA